MTPAKVDLEVQAVMPRRGGLAAAAVALLVLAVVVAVPGGRAAAEAELPGLEWFTVVDPDGRVICQTGFVLEVGDQYIDQDNRVWRIERVIAAERRAVARLEGTLDMSRAVEDFQAALAALPLAQGTARRIGIYHTHSDESYVPSDGTDSDPAGRGGVYRVGAELAKSLEKAGFTVTHSQTNHLPHDAGAYDRSRRTAMQLVQGAVAVFDVHRDAAPPEAYRGRVDGREIAQVMLVVGRANPQAEANMSFAQAIKAAADRRMPGLIRGILRTGGKFNQDLSSRALLLEVGAHTNRREDAEEAVAMLGSIIPEVIGAGGGGTAGPAVLRAIGLILLVAVGGGLLWLYVAVGGDWRAAWDKLKNLGEEFATYLGRRGRR